jgi:PIN domain nuclease of toxin-antitoxin system
MILVDTHILLFLGLTPERLSAKAKDTIEHAAPGELLISSVSAWEIAMLVSKKRIQLPLPPREWFGKVIKEYGIQDIVLDTASAARAMELPPIHNDPCDRWILATAMTFGLPLITADAMFAKYGVVPIIW